MLKNKKKHVPKMGSKNTGCKGVHATERPDSARRRELGSRKVVTTLTVSS
jgi:hypothetical protein